MTPITFVVAGDPEQRTGGYRYDARIVAGLRELGHPVSVAGLEGRFPEPDARAARALERALGACADGACVIVDGLVLGGLAETARAHADRLRLIALVHHPLADETGLTPAASARLLADERAALAVARAVVAKELAKGVWHMLTKDEEYKGFKGRPVRVAPRTYWPQPINPHA